MRSIVVASRASPQAAWAMYASPSRWPEWAPQLRGAWGLGEPQVRAGARGAARLLGVVPVPARILEVADGEHWTWRVGAVTMVHRVRPRPRGCTVEIDLSAPGPLDAAVGAVYGPVCEVMLRRLARAAERSAVDRG